MPETSATLVNGSFEEDWNGWRVGRDVPTDPNRDDRPVVSEAGVTTEDAADGATGCRLFLDGRQAEGTVWVQQPVDLTGVEYLAVDYRVSTSFNEIRRAAVFTGPDSAAPLEAGDFDTSQALDGHAEEGWKSFSYDVAADGPGLVAVGFTVVWETEATAVLDDVRLAEEQPTSPT